MEGSNKHLIKLDTINECLTCKVCNGYLIDATTIPECLHTFCKSCLVKHLTNYTTCPDLSCLKVIHYSNPLKYIRSDPTLQELVFKLVPNLQENENQRVDDFYKARNIPNPLTSHRSKPSTTTTTTNGANGQSNASDSSRNSGTVQPTLTDNMIGLELIPLDDETLAERLGFNYVRCSAYTTISKVKKLLALKLYDSIDKMARIDILYNEELLGKDHTLKFVIATRFKSKPGPLKLHYREATFD